MKTAQRDYTTVSQAIMVLEDDLLWSSDFEAIRKPLTHWLKSEMILLPPSIFAVQMADALLVDENDLTVR
jgi:hypothetical protein|tara:strand:- start:210 stop:419 length:210 start_codon:yes stop_codon:yes gene_type:complete